MSKKIVFNLIDRYSKDTKSNYPLSPNSLSNEDIFKASKVLFSKKITMGKHTRKFEKAFSKYLGTKYALMVNSGSSANLLAFFSLINPAKKNRLKTGDECLVPALCWSTSLWPIVQAGLKPKFVDVDPRTLNLSIKDLKKKITKKTKAIMLVHVLGNSTDLRELNLIIKKKKLFLIEDTCESLGSRYKNKFLGTFGNFGTFSFYYSHQITAGEGGMIVCNDKKDYEILYSLRSHGWDRGLNNSKNDFNFVNSGFNLRPTDINAAIGYSQFKKLNYFKKVREDNKKKILKTLINSKKWNNQFTFIDPIKHLDPSWFGLPILINRRYISKKKKFLNFLNNNGIETRPIISGNFCNQPSVKLYKLNRKKDFFPGAEEIEKRGFFIGIHIEKINNKKLKLLENKLLSIANL